MLRYCPDSGCVQPRVRTSHLLQPLLRHTERKPQWQDEVSLTPCVREAAKKIFFSEWQALCLGCYEVGYRWGTPKKPPRIIGS